MALRLGPKGFSAIGIRSMLAELVARGSSKGILARHLLRSHTLPRAARTAYRPPKVRYTRQPISLLMDTNEKYDLLSAGSLFLLCVLEALFVVLTYDQWSIGVHPGGIPIQVWVTLPIPCALLTLRGVKKRHKRSASVAKSVVS